MPQNLQDTLDFLRDLRVNNNKQWFDQNRKRYDTARDHFETLVAELIASFGDIEDVTGTTPKECIFRLNRDIRFSPDKTPYKTHMSAVIGKGGRKSEGRSYYLHIQPDGGSLLAGGMFSPTPQQLEKMRSHLAEDAKDFKKIIQNADFIRYFGKVQGEALKTTPKGYPKDHPDIDLLRLKQYLAEHSLTDAQVVAPDLKDHILQAFKAMKPFVTYIHEALGS